jgi:putative ABC transport system permease protein
VGLVVTIASALAPALRAGRVPPIAALRNIAIDRSHLSAARTAIGLGVTAGGVIASTAGTAVGGKDGLQLLMIGAVTTVLGVFVLGPVVARPVLRALSGPARALSGSVGQLAHENARRNPKRTSATAAALMIGVALVGFISILAASTMAAVTEQVDRSFRADFVIDSGQWETGGFSPVLAETLSDLPEVELASPLRATPVGISGTTAQLAGVDTATFERLYDIEVTRGRLADVAGPAIAVATEEAGKRQLELGDVVTVTFARTGEVDFTVSAIFDEAVAGVGGSSWITDLTTFETNVADQYDRQVFVSAVDGLDAAAARSAIDSVLTDWPNAELQDQAEFKESITAEINSILNLIYGLLALAVLIALIGIANTLALSVHERTRELGLLRAVGMTRGQVRTLVRWESVMIAVLGTGLGFLLAVAGAWAIVQALADEGITHVVIPADRIALIMASAVVAGVIAAAGPARRAARLDVLIAVAAD